MNIVLWVLQGSLSFLFFGAAYLHSLGLPQAQTMQGLAWTADVPVAFLYFLALCEFLGALGLILPAATRIRPQLTSLAAALLALLMLCAVVFLIARGEISDTPMSLVAGMLAAFVAYGRWQLVPIAARNQSR